MAILITKSTKVLVQGITGTQASFHTKRALEYGTNVVAGVTPGKGGNEHLGVPIFNTVKEAVSATQATASLLFVPAKYAKSAIREGIENEIDTMVCITEGIPIKDMLEIRAMLKGSRTRLIGPNTPGVISPGKAKLGIGPENIHRTGHIGIISRSSTLTYEAVLETSRAGLGQSTVIGLGDDILIGTGFDDLLNLFHQDKETKAIVIIGRMGGTYEEIGADFYRKISNKKPVIGFVAGNAVPLGHKMGYAGDIITNGRITVQDKKQAMRESGITVVDNINDLHIELAKLGLK